MNSLPSRICVDGSSQCLLGALLPEFLVTLTYHHRRSLLSQILKTQKSNGSVCRRELSRLTNASLDCMEPDSSFHFSSLLLAYMEPVAAESGIPQVKFFLNEVKMLRIVRFKTLIVVKRVEVTHSRSFGRWGIWSIIPPPPGIPS